MRHQDPPLRGRIKLKETADNLYIKVLEEGGDHDV